VADSIARTLVGQEPAEVRLKAEALAYAAFEDVLPWHRLSVGAFALRCQGAASERALPHQPRRRNDDRTHRHPVLVELTIAFWLVRCVLATGRRSSF
jgi:hypothetical protein